MKCVNTDWDHELIRRLKRGRYKGRETPKADKPTSSGDKPFTPVATVRVGKWTLEQRLAQRAAKEAEKRTETQKIETEQNPPSTPVESKNAKLFESPFWKIRTEIMEDKNRELRVKKVVDNQGFRKKMKILDDKAGEMKKILNPPRKPHQELPPVKRMITAPLTVAKQVDILVEKPKSAKLVNLDEVLLKRGVKKEPNFIDFSALTSGVWSDICSLEHGESIPIMMKSMKVQHWEKVIKYYGVFERAGRLDRGVLYELATDLGEKLLEHPTYREVVSDLDPDPNEGLFLLGKIMMNIYHIMAVQSGNNGRTLSIQEISSRLDSGYKNVMKTKKEEDARQTVRFHLRSKK